MPPIGGRQIGGRQFGGRQFGCCFRARGGFKGFGPQLLTCHFQILGIHWSSSSVLDLISRQASGARDVKQEISLAVVSDFEFGYGGEDFGVANFKFRFLHLHILRWMGYPLVAAHLSKGAKLFTAKCTSPSVIIATVLEMLGSARSSRITFSALWTAVRRCWCGADSGISMYT